MSQSIAVTAAARSRAIKKAAAFDESTAKQRPLFTPLANENGSLERNGSAHSAHRATLVIIK